MEEKQITTKQQEILNNMVPTIAEKLGVDPAEVTMEAQFTNDLGADSLDTVELMMEFEKEYNLSIPDNQQENIVAVGDVVRLIEKKQADPDWLPPVKSTQQPVSKVAGSKTTAKKPAATKKQSTPKDAGSKTTAKKPVATKPTKNVPADLLQTTVGEILKMPVAQALNLFDQIRSQMALRARAEKKK